MPFDYEKYVRIWFDWVIKHPDVPKRIVADMEMLLGSLKDVDRIMRARGIEFKVPPEVLKTFKLLKESTDDYRQIAESVTESLDVVRDVLASVDQNAVRLGTDITAMGATFERLTDVSEDFMFLYKKGQALYRFFARVDGMLDSIKRRAEDAGVAMTTWMRQMRRRFRLPVPGPAATYYGILRMRRIARENIRMLQNQLRWARANIKQDYKRGIVMRELARKIAFAEAAAKDLYETGQKILPWTQRLTEASKIMIELPRKKLEYDIIARKITASGEEVRKKFRDIASDVAELEERIDQAFKPAEEEVELFRRSTESLAESADAVFGGMDTTGMDEFAKSVATVRTLCEELGRDAEEYLQPLFRYGETPEALEYLDWVIQKLRDDLDVLRRTGGRAFEDLRTRAREVRALPAALPGLPELPPASIFDRLQALYYRLRHNVTRAISPLRGLFSSWKFEARRTADVNYFAVRSFYDLCDSQRQLARDMIYQYFQWLNVYKVVRDYIVQLYDAAGMQEILGASSQQLSRRISNLAARITNAILAGKEQEEQQRSAGAVLRRFMREIGRTSWRLSWFGYRMVMVGRILSRAWIPRVQDAVAALVNWQKTLPTVMLAIGMLAGTMNLTQERFEGLWDTATRIIEQGPEMEAAWFHFSAALLGISAIIGEQVKPLLFALGDMLLRLAPVIETTLAPALQSLVDMIIQNLPLIEQIIAQALPAFAEGFKLGAQAMITFMKFFAPVLPGLAKLLGVMLAFAPILEPIGHLLYFVGTAFAGLAMTVAFVSSVLSIAQTALSTLAMTLGLTNPATAALIAVVMVAIYVFTHWKQVVEAVTKAFRWLSDRIKDVSRWISNLGKTLRERLCFTHAAGYISEFNRELSHAIELSDRFQRQAQSLGGAAVGIAGGATVATQHVTIISNVHIGSVSSSVDLEDLESTINRAIAEAVRRRLG